VPDIHTQLTRDPRGALRPAANDGVRHSHPLDRKDDGMSEDMKNGSGCGPRRRAGVLGAVAGIALLAAACGGGGSSAAGGSSPYQKAVAYAQCMRSHGVPGFPDPDSKGNFLIKGPELGGSPRQYQAADKACRHLLPNGGQMTAAQQQKALSQALKFSACMRAHGLPSFPDPTAEKGGISLRLGGSGIGPNSPQLRAAQQACRSLMPGGGP
jgi:hypothetical protein